MGPLGMLECMRTKGEALLILIDLHGAKTAFWL